MAQAVGRPCKKLVCFYAWIPLYLHKTTHTPPSPRCHTPVGRGTLCQVEEDKFKLFYVLLQVPPTIVKHLNRVAQTGHDKLRLQLSGESSDAAGQENEEQAVEEASEVCYCMERCKGGVGCVKRVELDHRAA